MEENGRSYPLPETPWIMTQTWENLLFIHWPVSAESLRNLIPEELELETYNGTAWIGIIPFQVNSQRVRKVPEIPLFNEYLELNVRTYIKHNGVKGIFFFSLDASHPLAVLGARILSLPYKNASMDFEKKEDKVHFESKRVLSTDTPANFKAVYRPVSPPEESVPDSLEQFLYERYVLFTKGAYEILRGDILHEPWEVSKASLEIQENSMSPVELPSQEPLVHFCPSKTVFSGHFRRRRKRIQIREKQLRMKGNCVAEIQL
ncbi:DUF2071 domain-containing protein [Neobacillus terrae]|uniref:DUF2071 domain-containing protein n=1 Tax=Neobacillus terrae TaxID=3034837 RepID=UPI00140A426E|nr:DUF2071 domain-containing protein [Neobacillus terrae]